MAVLERIGHPRDLDRLTATELETLASECRTVIVETIGRRGGHLATNLGAVELTLALHRTFRSPHDRLVWDTSNQTYTHKLVTGRRDRFATIRTPEGLSGFAEPAESDHDLLVAGHAGTGLSYALGMSLTHQRSDRFVVAVVGDGALTSGPSYEALNNIGHLRPSRLVIIVNDNGWSISENIGWPLRWRDGRGAPSAMWESFGIDYIGPVDGHDQQQLEAALASARERSAERGPVVVHVTTQKGRGYPPAEENPARYHQPGTPSAAGNGGEHRTYSQVFAATLIELMAIDPRIVAVTAAMLEGTALAEVRRAYPDRVYDVGIAEEHALIMAAGMARDGLRPVVSIYSTFLQRAFDQIVHDVALPSLPVTLCIDRAGFVGDDGKTHHGLFDVAYTRIVPNMVVAAPKDEEELRHLLWTAVGSDLPFAIRYPRGLGAGVKAGGALHPIAVGRGEVVRPGGEVVLFAYGSMVLPALEAADLLAGHGVSCGVINARFAQPLDSDLLESARRRATHLFLLEEHYVAGGFGSAVLEHLHRQRSDGGAVVHLCGVPATFVEHAPQSVQRATYGLDAAAIVDTVLAALHPEHARRLPVALERRQQKPAETAGDSVGL